LGSAQNRVTGAAQEDDLMILFQIISIPVIAALFVRSIFNFVQGPQRRGLALLGIAVWLAAGVAILWPEVTVRVAAIVGIGRGADLVLYVFVIAFLFSWFFFYTKIFKLEANITELVRYFAIRDAMQGTTETEIPARLPEVTKPRPVEGSKSETYSK
jgi:hypothetical protein